MRDILLVCNINDSPNIKCCYNDIRKISNNSILCENNLQKSDISDCEREKDIIDFLKKCDIDLDKKIK